MPVAEEANVYAPTMREAAPEKPLKTTYINNRRYLGNKYKLLPFITETVAENCGRVTSVADIFAGTGAVASAFAGKRLITNDHLYSNYICHLAWFSPQAYSQAKIKRLIADYNTAAVTTDNYMSENFADTFFSRADCRKIGFVREDIELRRSRDEINERERALLITSLLYAADKIANTCGHYDAFRQGAEFGRQLELSVPLPPEGLNSGNVCCNEDTNALVKRISADLIYIDPPYNSRQYCDAYHLLENIARWEKPAVRGTAGKPDRTALKSDYCTNKAAAAFADLIRNINARYILLSYNNMAQKGNDRSNAKISDEDIMRVLSDKGDVRVFTQDYKPFSAGKSDIDKHEERLFLCVCKPKEREIIRSPLNYTGGKFKLLPQILPHFPERIDTFVDLFCGGGNVGINVNAGRVVFNDNNPQLIRLYNAFRDLGGKRVLSMIDETITKYGLSRSAEHGYDFYGCKSSAGLCDCNREPFLKLRADFNVENEGPVRRIMLYTLIVYAFNNQIRFNNKGEFNSPVGKRDFNNRMKAKLTAFIDRLSGGDYRFTCHDFREFDTTAPAENSLVYCDPPYLITCATYNEQGGWNEQSERDLLALLDALNERRIRFALSNVLTSKGRTNTVLAEWADKYRVIHLNHSYGNSNYHTKDKSDSADEILVVNY
ncbi:MAG: Dam family site-specific DNA-(adenine-N6)-methyltransferase [Clostridiales Family XIII bacterium]|jgi:adenine-specific DNA-methyltransferase|nr:Dam family site-specific DNA-(adenine-N6)-methyltransferase [Clostridiales Family XIII bacterium]